MLEHAAAGVGERHAAAGAYQQRFAQLDFQRPHLAAQRRLRYIEQERGLAEAAGLGYLDKSFYLLKIHDALEL
ncbi:hypothetical protein D3C71_2194770 [compost metagenome]